MWDGQHRLLQAGAEALQLVVTLVWRGAGRAVLAALLCLYLHTALATCLAPCLQTGPVSVC